MTDQWLVRTSQNLIHGPYSKQEICQFIQNAKLTTLDEVCSSSASGYWFFLHEIAEVKSQLGVNPPVPAHHPDDEVTETEVIRAANHLTSLADSDDPKDKAPETTGTTIMGSAEVGSQMRSAATAHAAPVVGAEREKEAAAAVHRAFRRSQEREEGDSPTWIRKFETLSFWKTVTIFLVIVTAALFISIVRLIRN
jgi:hypothetical protein